ncbi:hypothetical protein ACJJIX_11725 [Microbulbifer sp. VAAC004]|uniref:hypothetical protein n=1 Tax=unclassified Microbulbifer TaxID=2619833 RepID=UPI00403A6BFB
MPLNHLSTYAQLTDDQFTIIGKIVVEWSNIEVLLGQLLSRLLVTPGFLARSYTDQMSAVKLQAAIKEGVDIHKQRYNCSLINENQLKEILDVNDRITELRASRNKFAHFCWIRSTDDEIFGTNFSGGMPNTKKHKKSYITFTVGELAAFHEKAYKLVDELSALVSSLPELEEDGLRSKVTERSKTEMEP